MNNLLNKINVVNYILVLTFKIRKFFIVDSYIIYRPNNEPVFWRHDKKFFIEKYGWHWDNSVHNNNFTTYDRGLAEGDTERFMVRPGSIIHFNGILGNIDGKNTAYWLLQQELGKYCEIDVVEYDGRLGKLFFTSYYNTKSKEQDVSKKSQGKMKVKSSFLYRAHVWSVRWLKNSLTWYIDGIPVAYTRRNVPKDPMFLCVNNVRLNWIESILVEYLKT
jgi:beta-glucanase (GH16 family)